MPMAGCYRLMGYCTGWYAFVLFETVAVILSDENRHRRVAIDLERDAFGHHKTIAVD